MKSLEELRAGSTFIDRELLQLVAERQTSQADRRGQAFGPASDA